ncbi:hypothetical protein PL9214520208 [Planktothrix tepida PCC 9214]|uniref:Uncharacterized protein n=1 Tax=Planktothrix tepida PCC 9214 TaxID=671072 RepID=A0A1J1LM74_9CYAN|nr:hypothetical protein PL9214520208 [Planktothrix tepida PCC 9214]
MVCEFGSLHRPSRVGVGSSPGFLNLYQWVVFMKVRTGIENNQSEIEKTK